VTSSDVAHKMRRGRMGLQAPRGCSVSTPGAFGGLAKRLNDIVGEKDVDPEEGPEGELRDPLDFTELLEK